MLTAMRQLGALAVALKRIPTVAEVRADSVIGKDSASIYETHYTDEALAVELKRLESAGIPDVLQYMRRVDMLARDTQIQGFLQTAGVIQGEQAA